MLLGLNQSASIATRYLKGWRFTAIYIYQVLFIQDYVATNIVGTLISNAVLQYTDKGNIFCLTRVCQSYMIGEERHSLSSAGERWDLVGVRLEKVLKICGDG